MASQVATKRQRSQSPPQRPKIVKFERNANSPPLNDEVTYYVNSRFWKKCRLCPGRKIVAHIVPHYVKDHGGKEVYCSRLHYETAKILRETKSVPNDDCVFCRVPHDNYSTRTQWLEHFTMFTGEYMYRCPNHGKVRDKSCKNRNGCKNITAESKLLKLPTNSIMASICNECNWIQLNRARVIKHVRKQHNRGGSDEEIKKKHITKVKIFPAPIGHNGKVWNSIQKFHKNRTVSGNESDTDDDRTEEQTQTNGRVYQSIDTDAGPSQSTSNAGPSATVTTQSIPFRSIAGTSSDSESPTNSCKIRLPLPDSWTKVKPWIHEDAFAKKEKLGLHMLLALFKCMHPVCSFSTNDPVNMTSHIEHHQQQVPELEKLVHLKCCYCESTHDTASILVDHIRNVHGESTFQCANCFYRTVDLNSFAVHCTNYHRREGDQRKMFLCNADHSIKTDISQFSNDSLKLLTCGQCDYGSFGFANLFTHLAIQHPNELYSCGVCKEKVEIDRTEEHLEGHQMAELQCIYCEFGRREIYSLLEHMADCHPERPLFLAARRFTDPNHICIDMTGLTTSNRRLLQSYEIFKCPLTIDLQLEELHDKVDLAQIEEVSDGSFANYEKYLKQRIHQNATELMQIGANFSLTEKPCYCPFVANTPNDFVDHLKAEHSTQYNCVHCCSIIKKCTGVSGYINDVLEHLSMHDTLSKVFECPFCDEADSSAVDMIAHFNEKHKSDVTVLQMMYESTSIIIEYFCNLCAQCFLTAEMLRDHFAKWHQNCITDAQITIKCSGTSNTNAVKTNLCYRRRFKCAQDQCEQLCSTKSDMINHHDQKHRGKYLAFEITSPSIVQLTVNDKQNDLFVENTQMNSNIVYTCPRESCRKLWFSTESAVKEHSKQSHKNFRFSIEKLLRCSHCRSVSTLDMIAKYYRRNGEKPTTNDPIDETRCGACDYHIKDDKDFEEHYRSTHSRLSTRLFTDAMLQLLNLLETPIDYYIVDCCRSFTTFETHETSKMMTHLSLCKHGAKSINDYIQVIFENGFCVKLNYLSQTSFGQSLQNTLKSFDEKSNIDFELRKLNELKNNFVIWNIPKMPSEELHDCFTKICSKLNMNVPTADILDIHQGVDNSVVVKLTKFEDKRELIRRSGVLKLNVSDVAVGGSKSKRIYINSKSTPLYTTLAAIVKKAKDRKSLHLY